MVIFSVINRHFTVLDTQLYKIRMGVFVIFMAAVYVELLLCSTNFSNNAKSTDAEFWLQMLLHKPIHSNSTEFPSNYF